MAKDCGHKVPCGCKDTGLLTPPPCGDGIDCEGTPCSETFDAQCTFYTGEPILCGEDEVVTTNMSLSEAMAAVVAYFCTTSGHELQQALICGEDTVVAAGSDLDTTLQGIVSYFCGRLSTLETQVGNNTTALLNTVQVTQITGAPDPQGCTVTTTTIVFRDNGNNIIEQVSFNNTTCPPQDICAVATSEPNFDTLTFPACDGGTLTRIFYAYLRDRLAIDLSSIVPTTNSYGLFTQIGNSIPVTVSGSGSLIGPGAGTLLVPADTFNIGDSFRLSMHGHVSCDPNQDVNITVRSTGLSPVILAQTGTVTLPAISDEHFELKIDFTIRALGDLLGPIFGSVVSAGQFTYTKTASGGFDGVGFSQIVNLDTTVDNTLSIEIEWLTSSAGNSIYTEMLTLTKMF